MTDKPAPDSVFAPADDVLMTESGGVTVLMSMDSGQFVELNDSGSAIWELTDGKRDLAAVAEALCERFTSGAQSRPSCSKCCRVLSRIAPG